MALRGSLIVFLLLSLVVVLTMGQERLWTRIVGTSGEDKGLAVSTDNNGSVYVTGYSAASLFGEPYWGGFDIFLIRYSTNGTRVWTKMVGTAGDDFGRGVSADDSGSIYLTGYAAAALHDELYQGGTHDIILMKYAKNGTRVWTRMVGSAGDDRGYGVAVDSARDSIYVTGQASASLDGEEFSGGTHDIVLIKYDKTGSRLWTRMSGTAGADASFGLSVGLDGSVYVVGETSDSLHGEAYLGGLNDVVLMRYASNSTRIWTKLLGGDGDDRGRAVYLDASSDSVYLTGQTSNGMNGESYAGGAYDIFLMKCSTSGNRIWSKLVGTSGTDLGYGVSVNAISGEIYVTGQIADAIHGEFYAGGQTDMILMRFTGAGVRLGTRLVGSNGEDYGRGLAVSTSGVVYVTGLTQGSLHGEPYNGSYEVLTLSYSGASPTSMPTGHPSWQPFSCPSGQPSLQPLSFPSGQPSGQPSSRPSAQSTGQPTGQPSVQPTLMPSQPSGRPSAQPSSQPSRQPSAQPTMLPTSSSPTKRPSVQPSSQPSCQPTGQPSMQPTLSPSQPTGQPSTQPSTFPTSQPTGKPSLPPISFPSSQPSAQPLALPSSQPTTQPSGQPSAQPVSLPSSRPSAEPSSQPSHQPSGWPTGQPSGQPSSMPSQPSSQPSTQPTKQPSCQPTGEPSTQPSIQPSSGPSSQPTSQPSSRPSTKSTGQPTNQPSLRPSSQPTSLPTAQPSTVPSTQPTSHPSAQPSSQPSDQPSIKPTMKPSGQPSSHPTGQPTTQPTMQPSSRPTVQPSIQPSSQPSAQPSDQPSWQPSLQPSTQPSLHPTGQPTTQPTMQPSSRPAVQPSIQPSTQPSAQPSDQPSWQPSTQPSTQPSGSPSGQPSHQPSSHPTGQPSSWPTGQPLSQPSVQPSHQPSNQPTDQPTVQPTSQPTSAPSKKPSVQPTSQPTHQPSVQPSTQPSSQPTCQPIDQPSAQPSFQPSGQPIDQPSAQPSGQPLNWPTSQPTLQPSAQPSCFPTNQPTCKPSTRPSVQPSRQPTSMPTRQPSKQPSSLPSLQPTCQPTDQPSSQPSCEPTIQPSRKPSSQPFDQPTSLPTSQPSSQPTWQPTSIPTSQPSFQPVDQPSAKPSTQPSGQPTGLPSLQLTFHPSSQPTCQPISFPTLQPSTVEPSSLPSCQPINGPSLQPTAGPTGKPFGMLSAHPSRQPTGKPTLRQIMYSDTLCPSISCTPSIRPSRSPTIVSTFFSVLPGPDVSSGGNSTAAVPTVNATLAIGVLSSLSGSQAQIVVVTDDVRVVSQVLPRSNQAGSFYVTLPLTEQETVLQSQGKLVLPSISLLTSTSDTNGSVYVAVAMLSSSLWLPPTRSENLSVPGGGNITPPPLADKIGQLQSDVITVVTIGPGVDFVDIEFPLGTTATVNSTPAIIFTIYCPPRVVTQKTFYCNDTGYVERILCSGQASVFRGVCPKLKQTCSALDLASMTVAGSNLCETVIRNFTLINETSDVQAGGILCRCSTGAGLDVPGSSMVAAGVVLGLVTSDLSKTFQASSAFRDGSAASKAAVVLSAFVTLWAIALIAILFFFDWRLFSENDQHLSEGTKNFFKGPRNTAMVENVVRKTENINISYSEAESQAFKELAENYLSVMFPAVFMPSSFLEGFFREVYRKHVYINLFLRLHKSPNPIIDIVKVVTLQSFLLFLLALLYDLNYPSDDGSCRGLMTEVDCLKRRSLLDPSQTYCKWAAFQYSALLATDDDAVYFECIYGEPVASVTTATYTSMILSLASCLLIDPLEYILALLTAPSLDSGSDADLQGKPLGSAVLSYKDLSSPAEAFVRFPATTRSSTLDNRIITTDNNSSDVYRCLPTPLVALSVNCYHLVRNMKEDYSEDALLPEDDARLQPSCMCSSAQCTAATIDSLEAAVLRERVFLLSMCDIQPKRLDCERYARYSNLLARFDLAWCLDKATGNFLELHISKLKHSSPVQGIADHTTLSHFMVKEVVNLRGVISEDIMAVQKEAASVIAKLSRETQPEIGFEIMVQFVQDILGRHTAAARIFAMKMELDNETLPRIQKWVKISIIAVLVCLNAFFFFFTLLRGISKGHSWQRSYLIAWLLQSALDICVFETMQCAWFHYFIPSLAREEVSAAKEIVKDTIAKMTADTVRNGRKYNCDQQLNASDFLFVSSQVAKKYPDLLESMWVQHYRSTLPGKAGDKWQQVVSKHSGNVNVSPGQTQVNDIEMNSQVTKQEQTDATHPPQTTSTCLYSTAIVAFFSSITVVVVFVRSTLLAFILQVVILAPLHIQSLLTRVVEPLALSGVWFFILLVISRPVYLALTVVLFFLLVLSVVWEHVHKMRRQKKIAEETAVNVLSTAPPQAQAANVLSNDAIIGDSQGLDLSVVSSQEEDNSLSSCSLDLSSSYSGFSSSDDHSSSSSLLSFTSSSCSLSSLPDLSDSDD